MKKLIPILSLGLALSLNSYSQEYKNKIQVVEGSGTEYLLSEDQVEKQLHKLARNNEWEDYWIYNDGVLVDMGIHETKKSVYFDFDFLNSIKLNPKKKIYFLHIHPKKSNPLKIKPPSYADFMMSDSIKNLKKLKDFDIEFKVLDGRVSWNYYLKDKNSLSYAELTSIYKKNLKKRRKIFSKNNIENVVDELGKKGLILKYKK